MPAERVNAEMIAAACGVAESVVARKWAQHPAWPAGDRTGLGGKLTWAVSSLPTAFPRRNRTINVRALVERYLVLREQSALSPGPSPACGRGEQDASGGDLIPAGSLSPVVVPAATGAGEVTGGGGVIRVGMVLPAVLTDDATRRAAVAEAARRAQLLGPLLVLPERSKGRREVAKSIGRDLGLSVQQVYRLEKQLRQGGVINLAGKTRADKGQARVLVGADFEAYIGSIGREKALPDLAKRLLHLVRGAWAAGAPSAQKCWLEATARLARDLLAEGWNNSEVAGLLKISLPRRFVEPEKARYQPLATAQRDAKGAYDRHIAPVRRTAAGYRPGDLVCGDISPLDIPVLRPDGSLAYARMIVWHDVATNWLWADLFLCNAGEGIRREHVAASFARMCEEAPFGAPKRLYLDNGSEYKWVDMLEAWSQLATLTAQTTAVDVADLLPPAGKLVRSIPFHPRGKRVEGQFGDLRYWLSWHPGHVGGNRIDKKVQRLGQAPLAEDFERVEGWFKDVMADYHATPQGGELDGKSPQMAIDWHLNTGWRPHKIDREALMLAFAEARQATITHGTVRFANQIYFADFLMGLVGKVTVKVPRVAGPGMDCAFIFDGNNQFLGVAAPERIYGVLEGAGAVEAGRRRAAYKLLMAERATEAPALDPRESAGIRAQVLDVAGTVARAQAAAIEVGLSDEMLEMARRRNELSERTRLVMAKADAAKDAEKLHRLVQEDDEVALARAMGF